jgi:plastocyanin domain-containing protein
MKSILFVITVGVVLAGCQQSDPGTTSASSTQPSQQAESAATGAQKLTVTVDNGFSPESLNVKAGQPVEITFDTKHKACATQVIFEGLGIKKDLTDGQKTVVSFTPDKAGTYAFACPMNMFKGEVVAK